MEGLRIAKIDGDKVEVTTRPLAFWALDLVLFFLVSLCTRWHHDNLYGLRSEAKVGEKVQGIVMTKIKAG